MNNLRGAFRILQVVSATNSTLGANSTTTFVDTGLTATITCQNNTSKVLVIVQQSFSKNSGNPNNAVQSRIVSGATSIHYFQGAALYTGSALDLVGPSTSGIILDNPTTTAPITYKTQYANFSASAAVGCNPNSAMATIILMEISA